MTPYKTGCRASIDPTYLKKELLFGPVPKECFRLTAKITNQKYLSPKKTQIYELHFWNGQVHWFAESEIIAFNR